MHFRPFPKLPVYVCSRHGELSWHRVAPLAFSGDPVAAFLRLRGVLATLKRTTVVHATDDHLRAVCRTPLGFRDDVECHLSAAEGVIHVRSVSRIAPFWDLGVNRRRVAEIRRRFQTE